MQTYTIRKLLALLLAVLMLASCLTACGDKSDDTDKNNGNATNENNDNPATADGILFYQEEHVTLGTPDKKLNPQEVYDDLTYIPEMFYGRYTLSGGEKAEEDFAETAHYMERVDDDYKDGRTAQYTELPFRLEAGKHTFSHYINYVTEHNWLRAYFMKKSETDTYLDYSLCSYEIEGNTLTLRLVKEFHVDEDTKKITYTFSDVALTYEFSFNGRQLTLTTDNDSVTMWSGKDYTGENDFVDTEHYVAKDSNAIGNIDYLSLSYNGESKRSYLHADGIDGDSCYEGIACMEENGLFTITLPWEESESVVTYQYVYFLCGDDGIVLTDGTNHYLYTANISDRYKNNLNDFVTEDQTGKMEELSDAQLEQVVKTKEQLLQELEQAFEEEGISVTVNGDTGEMAMDASILFGGDSAVLTDAGKDFIRRFVAVYTTVTAGDKYTGFISHTMVEGHTAPVGNSTYEDGLPLSVERAKVVKEYCLSLGNAALQDDDLDAIGHSNSKPIKDKNGNVDMAASRRVSFRFIIDLEGFFN